MSRLIKHAAVDAFTKAVSLMRMGSAPRRENQMYHSRAFVSHSDKVKMDEIKDMSHTSEQGYDANSIDI